MRNLIITVALILAACNGHGPKSAKIETAGLSEAPLTVYYFHATNRCPTCISIEANTRKVLDEYFTVPVSKGEIAFRVINVDDPGNKKLCEKFKAFGSALHVVKNEKGKETDSDLTNIAFSYSLRQPERFINILLDTISMHYK